MPIWIEGLIGSWRRSRSASPDANCASASPPTGSICSCSSPTAACPTLTTCPRGTFVPASSSARSPTASAANGAPRPMPPSAPSSAPPRPTELPYSLPSAPPCSPSRYPCRGEQLLAQTNSLRIRQGSLLTGNGMVAPGCRHASLVPPLPFARRIPASVQHRGNLVVTVASSHTANDIQRLHRRGGFLRRTRPLHRNLRMHTSLPVNHKLKGLVILVIILGSAHDDLFDGGAEDHLLECRRTVVTLPDFSKAITHRAYSDFLFN